MLKRPKRPPPLDPPLGYARGFRPQVTKLSSSRHYSWKVLAHLHVFHHLRTLDLKRHEDRPLLVPHPPPPPLRLQATFLGRWKGAVQDGGAGGSRVQRLQSYQPVRTGRQYLSVSEGGPLCRSPAPSRGTSASLSTGPRRPGEGKWTHKDSVHFSVKPQLT